MQKLQRQAMLIKFINPKSWDWAAIQKIEVEADKQVVEKGDIVYWCGRPLIVYEDLGPLGTLRVYQTQSNDIYRMKELTRSSLIVLDRNLGGKISG